MPDFTDKMLVIPGWPRGFCGRHSGELDRCNVSCVQSRVTTARLERDLWAFWLKQFWSSEQAVS